jgi:voltage-gated potassium channel
VLKWSRSSVDATLLLPREEIDPVRAITRRVAIGVGVLLLIAVLVWLDRDGYSDSVDDRVSFLDALYYATVSASTTGFGDIAPVSDAARTVNTLIITPLRVLFVVVLVGTTLEVATRTSRNRRRVLRWQDKIDKHTVVIGFGTMGRAAASRLVASGTSPGSIVVVADDPATVADATTEGFVAVDGDATRQDIVRAAVVDRACCVIVALPNDATAVLATLTARQLSPSARIVGAVNEQENGPLLHDSGADAVMVTADATGRQLALSLSSHAVGELYEQLLNPGRGVDLVERRVRAAEVGLPVRDVQDAVVAVVRDGHVQLEPHDGLVLAAEDRLAIIVERPR